MNNKSPRFIVGIDFGTTNSAVTYLDTNEGFALKPLNIYQLTAVNEYSDIPTLPSFVYFPLDENTNNCGVHARETGQITPERVISSAKSWLCHTGVDRHKKILPWHGAEDIDPLTPVEACSALLTHIKENWNRKFPEDHLEKQELVLTVPASFDESARSFIAEAIQLANLPNAVLLEEPQAAFYAWMGQNQDSYQAELADHKNVLVIDIGGGTTDFSIIGIEHEDQKIKFNRIAVGDHLLLGGDNLDLTIAHYLEQKNGSTKLSIREWGQLINQSRKAKETLLGTASPEVKETKVLLTSRGKSLIANAKSITLTKEEILPSLLDGFLPDIPLDSKPSKEKSGFLEFGLPYANDTAMTKHLAAFLSRSCKDVSEYPTAILFNGGFFEAKIFQEKIETLLKKWTQKSIKVLKNAQLDLAVSKGAAWYGLVRRGLAQKIEGGLPRSTFIAVKTQDHTTKAFCVAPIGMQEGETIEFESKVFHLRLNQPIEFPIYSTEKLSKIEAGELIDIAGLKQLPSIRAFLKVGKKNKSKAKDIEVYLMTKLNSIGLLELYCHEKNGERKWKLEFDTKNIINNDLDTEQKMAQTKEEIEIPTLPQTTLDAIEQAIADTFAEGAKKDPDALSKNLESIIGQSKWSWDIITLRYIWQCLMNHKAGRSKSIQHESRWLNLTGFSLRPGYGVAMDDWRTQQTWNIYLEGVTNQKNSQVVAEWYLFWNRIAGGLSTMHQTELSSQFVSAMRILRNLKVTKNTQQVGAKVKKLQMGSNEKAQFWRMLGNLEHLAIKDKKEIIEYLLHEINKNGIEDANRNALWSLGRIAARNLLYGNLNSVLAPKQVHKIFEALQKESKYLPQDYFSLLNMIQMTGDRYRDLETNDLTEIITWLKSIGVTNPDIEKIQQLKSTSQSDQNTIFGEQLPIGLKLIQ